MPGQNFYNFIGVATTASPNEIDAAITGKYNEWRRLVTHHDPNIANQANQALQTLEQARGTLLDQQQRSAYDASLGLTLSGGLADPAAILGRITGMGIPGGAGVPGGTMTPPGSGMGVGAPRPVQPTGIEQGDKWVCPRCQTAHAIGTRFCKQCGNELAVECPVCKSLMETGAVYCQHCGVNVREHKNKLEEEQRYQEMQAAQARRLQIERDATLGPVMTGSANAWNATKWGCILSFIPGLALISLPLWMIGIYYSRKVLGMSQVSGDSDFRATAKKAFRWAVVPLGVIAAGLVVYALLAIILALANTGQR
jgi:hypothetical protein